MTPKERTATHPGIILAEEFMVLPRDVSDLGKATGLPRKVLEELVEQRRPVTPIIAARLGRVFNTTPDFWMNLQNVYDTTQ